MSLRDSILGADDLEERTVEVPEWDCKVLLRAMSGGDQLAYASTLSNDKQQRYMWADILISSVRDPEDGSPVFEPSDREALAGKSAGVSQRLANIVIELSGLSPGDMEAEIEEDPT